MDKNTIEELCNGRFNPGGATAVYESAGQGISPLACMPKTTAEREAAVADEDLDDEEDSTVETRAEKKERKKTPTRQPPRNYYELLTMIGTYTAWLYVLFGQYCPLYQECHQLYDTLDSDEVENKKNKFNRTKCAQVTWQVIEASRAFFNKVLGPEDFAHGGPWVFPKSNLGRLIKNIQ